MLNMIKRVLGFDISSTTTGYSIVTYDNVTKDIKFISTNYIKPLKKGTIIERVADTRDKIKKIIEKEKPDYIGIEDILMFIKGKSTANTVIVLATFNRMVGLLSFDYLKSTPALFGVMAIRRGLQLTDDVPKKEDIPELVAKHLGITFPYQLDKKGKIKVESYDMADSIAVALFYALVLAGKATVTEDHFTHKPKKKRKKRKSRRKKTKK